MSSLEKLEFVKPADIETRSFEIITSELGDRVLDPENELVIKRVIHTSADFEYADTLVFSEHATTIGVEALRNGSRRAATSACSANSAARCATSSLILMWLPRRRNAASRVRLCAWSAPLHLASR